MGKEEVFDSFYRSTRARLLHQAFALTGDLSAAQSAVRDGFVSAWHHWRKVSRLDDPEDWVRPRAWRLAQHRHNARLWHRTKGLSEEHQRTLAALGKLSSAQRRALLLVQLAALQLPEAARELAVTQQVAEQHLQAATATVASQLEIDSTAVRGRLESLSGPLAAATLPRASIIRRAGRKRRQGHTLVAVLAAAAVTVASGAAAYTPQAAHPAAHGLLRPEIPLALPSSDEPSLPTAGNLLDQDQIARLGQKQTWRVVRTDNNTSGDGLNTVCQQQRFADPKGLSAIVRTFTAVGSPPRSAVQTVEISRSLPEAEQTFQTTVGWYAGCQASRLQLLNAYRVDNIGDKAVVLMMRVWDHPVTTYSVAVARTGTVTTSTVGKTVGAAPPPAGQIVQSLADAVSMLCGRSGATACAKQPTYQEVPPPPSGREHGILAVADLPPVGRIGYPWVATDPVTVRQNPSATTCDHADFAAAGSRHTIARTYLIPQAHLPAQFGLSETYGVFPDAGQAQRFLSKVRHTVAGCEHRDLSTKVTASHTERANGLDLSTWDLETAVTDHQKVHFRVGFVRVDNLVAQLTFATAPHDDMTSSGFHDLVVRAGDRLRELQ
jgi:DNA-directed RNA polymerase specialized sigma24 family protein